jgi:hypothetical protein
MNIEKKDILLRFTTPWQNGLWEAIITATFGLSFSQLVTLNAPFPMVEVEVVYSKPA